MSGIRGGLVRPVALVILDGWGHSESSESNAIALANTPNFDRLWKSSPHTFLTTCGEAVGLPTGVMGNSEVGHLNIGAGRIVYQDLTKINKAIKSNELEKNVVLLRAFSAKTLHLMGLVSDGGVHSHIDHLEALLRAAAQAGVPQVFVHAFTDGRDTSPTGGIAYLERIQKVCKEVGNAQIVTVCGRYYAMDRDLRWDRIKLAYQALVNGVGEQSNDPIKTLKKSYAANITDEFILPTVITNKSGEPLARMQSDDSVLFFNFRGDRARQIVRALGENNFNEFNRGKTPPELKIICMTEYNQDFNYPVMFASDDLKNVFGEVVSNAGLHQLRIAETEKYAHVTFFFNGGKDQVSPGEDHVLIQSPKDVATYDLKPEMSAFELTDVVVDKINSGKYDTIILNFANVDMVGHSGKVEAAIRAVETVDSCLSKVVEAVLAQGGVLLVTADHGNAEQMTNADGSAHTSHTTNQVPCLLVSKNNNFKLRDGGILADLAPTLCELLNIKKSPEMTGESLLIK